MAVETRIVQAAIPSDLLMCEVPTPEGIAHDSDAADYLIRLYGAARQCAANMQAVRRIIDR